MRVVNTHTHTCSGLVCHPVKCYDSWYCFRGLRDICIGRCLLRFPLTGMPFGFKSRSASPIAVGSLRRGRLRRRPLFPSPRQPRQESTAGATPLPAPCLARLPADLGPRLIPSAAGNPLIIVNAGIANQKWILIMYTA